MQIVHTAIIVGGVMFGLLGILLALPQMKLRDVVLPIINRLINGR